MRNHAVLLAGLLLACGTSSPASAGPCDAYYHFDGDLADASGSGHDGQMVGANGVPATPQFVAGRYGQALRLDGSAAMRVFIDLAYEACPQVTVAAWVNIEPQPSQMFFGASHGLHIMASNDQINLRADGNDIVARDAVYANGGWMYIAGAWDAETRHASFHWRGREVDGDMGNSGRKTPPAIFFGALNDALHFPAKQMIIDEVRIVGRALDAQQLAELQQSTAPNAGVSAASSLASTAPADAAGGSCAAQSDCAGGTYCAADGTCHPESHLPMTAGGGTTFADVQAALAERNAARGMDVDYDRPPDLLSQDASQDDGRTLEEMQAGFAERNADSVEVDYDRPPDLLSGSGGSGGGSGGDAPAAGEAAPHGPIGGFGGMTVSDYLGREDYSNAPSGNVRDCTSFAEVVGDLATGIRDAIVNFAATNSCALLTRAVHDSQAALYVQDADGYQTPEFADRLLAEVYDDCVASTTAAGQIPDRMLGFWNGMVGKDSWATIGPRELEFGKTHNGNLVAPGDRKFVSIQPVIGRNSTSLGLQELDGRARVNARICTVTLHNRYTRLASLTINETPEERDNQSQFIVRTLDNVAWRFVIVYLDAAGRPGRNFKYELRVD